jgi:hypothetical protein
MTTIPITVQIDSEAAQIYTKENTEKFRRASEERLLKPAQPIDRTKFETLLDQVASVEPPEWDKL